MKRIGVALILIPVVAWVVLKGPYPVLAGLLAIVGLIAFYAALGQGAAGQGEIPASQTTIPAQSQCTKSTSAMPQCAFCGFLKKAPTSYRDCGQSYDIDRIGRFARPQPDQG